MADPIEAASWAAAEVEAAVGAVVVGEEEEVGVAVGLVVGEAVGVAVVGEAVGVRVNKVVGAVEPVGEEVVGEEVVGEAVGVVVLGAVGDNVVY